MARTSDFQRDPQRDAWWNDERTIILGEDMPVELETEITEWMPPRLALDLAITLRTGGPREQ